MKHKFKYDTTIRPGAIPNSFEIRLTHRTPEGSLVISRYVLAHELEYARVDVIAETIKLAEAQLDREVYRT